MLAEFQLPGKPHISTYLRELGIQPELVGEKLGTGFYHTVFQNADNPDTVLKFPNVYTPFIPIRSPLQMELFNRWTKRFFHKFYLPTSIHMDSSAEHYVVEQLKYQGRILRCSDLEKPEIRYQFDAITNANAQMVQETGFSMDFQGFDMYIDWLKNRWKPGYDAGLSNIVVTHVDNSPKLLVTDYDLLNASLESFSTTRIRSALILTTSFICQNYSLQSEFGVGLKS